MIFTHKGKGLIIILAALAVGCAQVPKEAGFGDIQQLVGQRVDYRLYWNQGSEADTEVAQAIENLLAEELSVDGAVQIALLNNPTLQATYEDLGITQADVVEAGLLDNPVFFTSARFPDRSPWATNLDFAVTQNFLSILMQPAKKKLAAIQFEQVKLRVSDEVLKLTAEVKKAFFEVVAARQINQMQHQINRASQTSYEMARRLYQAGNISKLDLANEQGQFEQVRMMLAESEENLLAAREQLTRLMGLWGYHTDWQIPGLLPEIPQDEIPFENLITFAVENRLDLSSARKEVEVLAQALGITVDWRWFGSVEFGISSERDTDGQWVLGPTLAFELPIFNQRQADIARLEAQLRQKGKQLIADAIDIRSEVRSLRSRLIMKRNLIDHYKKVLIPLREEIVGLTMQKYNFMLMGVFDLIMAKQQEYRTYRDYINAVRDYWIIRTALQRSVGGRFPLPDSVQAQVLDPRTENSFQEAEAKPTTMETHSRSMLEVSDHLRDSQN